MDNWRNIEKDPPPKVEDEIILGCGVDPLYGEWRMWEMTWSQTAAGGAGGWIDPLNDRLYSPTHWMPRLSPPDQ